MITFLLRSFYVLFLLGGSFIGVSFANEKYSFEKTEALKPLIEWREYSPSTFAEASAQKKPIFLVLTAPSWCYWCQVYESEEYLFDPSVYILINEKTIPVYVDADQRQDLTRKYLEGGRPSTTVMTPDGARIFGYSGPRPIPNMIQNIENAVQFVQNNAAGGTVKPLYIPTAVPETSTAKITNLETSITYQAENTFDREYGGFGNGQKFPQGRILNFFVDQYKTTKEVKRIEKVQLTLEQQYTSPQELETNYNLYDPIEGGFHRYGTTRNRDPPHYEKMLYDNVRLLNAYHNYRTTGLDDPYVNEVLAGTWKYLIGDYYDTENGGFYANTDVNGEAAYYAQNPRPTQKARVEKTKYTDRNADAMVSLIAIRKRQSEMPEKDMLFQTPTGPYTVTLDQLDTMIQDTLAYLQEEIVTKQGAFHYMTPERKKGVRGSIIDHALLTLAFVDAYEVYETPSYLKSAKRIADYSLDHLYDWYGGGFFERNSPDRHLYALGDHIDLTKPVSENGVFSYALTKLSSLDDDPEYTIAAQDTVARLAEQPQQGYLDKGYYALKASQEARAVGLLEKEVRRDSILAKKQKNSRLNGYIDGSAYENEFELSAVGLESFTNRGFGVFAVLALLAGLLSFLSPCTLPVLPAYVANILRSKKGNTFSRVAGFMIGLIGIFTILGLSATRLGSLFHGWIERLVPVIGVILMIIGMMLVMGEEFSWMSLSGTSLGAGIEKIQSSSSSVLLGMSMGIMWTPCVGPILLSILAVAGLQSQLRQGALLLVLYGLGLAIPLLLVGFVYDRWRGTDRGTWFAGRQVQFFGKQVHTTTLIAGCLLIAVGLLSVFGGLDLIASRGAKSFGSGWLGQIERGLLGE